MTEVRKLVQDEDSKVAVRSPSQFSIPAQGSDLNRLREQLRQLRQSKEREQEADENQLKDLKQKMERAVEDIQSRMNKREHDLFEIKGRQHAITTALRTLEDLGIDT